MIAGRTTASSLIASRSYGRTRPTGSRSSLTDAGVPRLPAELDDSRHLVGELGIEPDGCVPLEVVDGVGIGREARAGKDGVDELHQLPSAPDVVQLDVPRHGHLDRVTLVLGRRDGPLS